MITCSYHIIILRSSDHIIMWSHVPEITWSLWSHDHSDGGAPAYQTEPKWQSLERVQSDCDCGTFIENPTEKIRKWIQTLIYSKEVPSICTLRVLPRALNTRFRIPISTKSSDGLPRGPPKRASQPASGEASQEGQPANQTEKYMRATISDEKKYSKKSAKTWKSSIANPYTCQNRTTSLK